jgi:hypothetical protein
MAVAKVLSRSKVLPQSRKGRFVVTYRGQAYSCDVIGAAFVPKVRLYGWLADDSFLLTFSESLLKRAVDRQLAGPKEPKPDDSVAAVKPWLGRHLCLQVSHELLDVANTLSQGQYRRDMQRKAWGNLAILNEWKQVFPNEDPVAVHRRVWDVELVCPSGGRYVWNDAWKTMESTLYGHPGEPKDGPPAPALLNTFNTASFGIDFEDNGLRARVNLQRTAGAP